MSNLLSLILNLLSPLLKFIIAALIAAVGITALTGLALVLAKQYFPNLFAPPPPQIQVTASQANTDGSTIQLYTDKFNRSGSIVGSATLTPGQSATFSKLSPGITYYLFVKKLHFDPNCDGGSSRPYGPLATGDTKSILVYEALGRQCPGPVDDSSFP